MSDEHYFVNINGTIYEMFGYSFADSLYNAVAEHVEKDMSFCEYILITKKGDTEYKEVIYSPAILCGFDFIDRETLYKHLVSSVIEDA